MTWSKTSCHECGYDYAWVKVRNQVMERDEGECYPCKRAGHAVDHIVSKAGAMQLRWPRARTDHLSNLEAICESRHLVKTESEQRKMKRRSKRSSGADGWPT